MVEARLGRHLLELDWVLLFVRTTPIYPLYPADRLAERLGIEALEEWVREEPRSQALRYLLARYRLERADLGALSPAEVIEAARALEDELRDVVEAPLRDLHPERVGECWAHRLTMLDRQASPRLAVVEGHRERLEEIEGRMRVAVVELRRLDPREDKLRRAFALHLETVVRQLHGQEAVLGLYEECDALLREWQEEAARVGFEERVGRLIDSRARVREDWGSLLWLLGRREEGTARFEEGWALCERIPRSRTKYRLVAGWAYTLLEQGELELVEEVLGRVERPLWSAHDQLCFLTYRWCCAKGDREGARFYRDVLSRRYSEEIAEGNLQAVWEHHFGAEEDP